MRKTCLDMVHHLARDEARVVFVGSDLGPGVLAGMRREIPERFFMEGISEAAVVGMAAGLAMDGFIPYVNTIANFLTRRALEQIALDVCLHRLPVRLIANGGGLVYAPLGPTHVAHEDFALMSALPHMTVVAACDADEMRRLMAATLTWPDPIYIRLAKGGDAVVSRPELPFAIGKAIPLLMPETADVLIVSTGVMTQEALGAAAILASRGIACRVLHCHTVKPLDVDGIRAASRGVRLLVTLEEHSLVGGLGSGVLMALHGNGAAAVPTLCLALPDKFFSDYGSQRAQWESCGLTAPQIALRLSGVL